MAYHVDQLFAAVSVLVTHGPVKQRLMRAYEDNLDEINREDLPFSVQESFAELQRLMHSVSPMNGEGPICASVRKMSKEQADDCSQRIVKIYGEVPRVADDAEMGVPLNKDEPAIVPPFLVKSG